MIVIAQKYIMCANAGKVEVRFYDKDSLYGSVCSLYFNTGLIFRSYDELIFAIEDLINTVLKPMNSVHYRSFLKSKRKIKKKQVLQMKDLHNNIVSPEKATFIINVLYRQNSTWQGTIQWVNQNQSQNFRSTYELIKLMDSALSDDAEQHVNWDLSETDS